MKANIACVLGIILIVFLAPSAVLAQGQTAPSTVSNFKHDLIKDIESEEKKLISLAEAVPAEKFSWIQVEGLLSISEVYMHVAGRNYLLPSFAGVTPPPGISRDMEKTITEKDKVIDALKQSFVHLHQAVEKIQDADFDKNVKYFGDEVTVIYVFLDVTSYC